MQVNEVFKYNAVFQGFMLSCMYKDTGLWGDAFGHLSTSDFGPLSLRAIHFILSNYFKSMGELPGIGTLAMLIEQMYMDPSSEIRIDDNDLEQVVAWLDKTTALTPSGEDINYCRNSIPNFMAHTRLNKLEASNLGVSEKMVAFEHLQEQMAAAKPSRFNFVKALGEVDEEESGVGKRFLIGVRTVDAKLGNGIQRKEGCLIVAPTGVGKTNTMLGAMAATSRMGEHSLFIALEMNNARLQERYHSILGGIPANLNKQRRSKWPECYRKRYEYLMSPACDALRDRATFLNLAGENCGYRDIDEAIKAWKRLTAEEGKDPDEVCTTVYIDWLKKVSTTGITVSKDSKSYDAYDKVCVELNKIWINQNIRMFISTQATGASKGKELLTRLDIAEGKNFANQMDAVIGLAPVSRSVEDRNGLKIRTIPIKKVGDEEMDDLDEDFKVYSETDVTLMSECNRTLNCCFMKTRDAAEEDTFIPVYQDPTLRLWTNKDEAYRRRLAIENNPTFGL